MLLARQNMKTDQLIETPRGITGVPTLIVLIEVGWQTGSIFWGKVPSQLYGRSTTTAKRRARRNKTPHHATKKFGK